MTHSSQLRAAILSAITVATPVLGQSTGQLAVGSYRIEGKCSHTFYLGAESAPECEEYSGIRVQTPERPMFIFPLKNGRQGWFFVASGQTLSSSDRAVYAVDKLYDQALNAEFSYPAGEYEISTGPTVRCTVWKNPERTLMARELVFLGSGNWMRGK